MCVIFCFIQGIDRSMQICEGPGNPISARTRLHTSTCNISWQCYNHYFRNRSRQISAFYWVSGAYKTFRQMLKAAWILIRSSDSEIASIIRKTIQKAREPENTRRLLALIAEKNAANFSKGYVHRWFPMENTVVVNNLARSVPFQLCSSTSHPNK